MRKTGFTESGRNQAYGKRVLDFIGFLLEQRGKDFQFGLIKTLVINQHNKFMCCFLTVIVRAQYKSK